MGINYHCRGEALGVIIGDSRWCWGFLLACVLGGRVGLCCGGVRGSRWRGSRGCCGGGGLFGGWWGCCVRLFVIIFVFVGAGVL